MGFCRTASVHAPTPGTSGRALTCADLPPRSLVRSVRGMMALRARLMSVATVSATIQDRRRGYRDDHVFIFEIEVKIHSDVGTKIG
jgi:hypothetical protein